MLLTILGSLVSQSGTPTLTPDPLTHVQSIGSTSLNSDLAIQPAALVHVHALAQALLTPTGDTLLTPASISHSHVVSSPSLTPTTVTSITPFSIEHGHFLSQPSIQTGPVLTPAQLTHPHSVEQVVLSTSLHLTPANILHAHVLANAVITSIAAESLLGRKIAVLIESLKYSASSTDDGITIVVTRDPAVDVTVNQS